jgi:transcriptional regulator with XRE-family HTH domain
MTQNNEGSKRVGQKLKEEREYRGFSEQEIAEYLSTSQTEIEEIENGQKKIDSERLGRLAELYDVSVSQLRGDQNTGSDEAVKIATRSNHELSETDKNEINRFAEFLKARHRQGGSND